MRKIALQVFVALLTFTTGAVVDKLFHGNGAPQPVLGAELSLADKEVVKEIFDDCHRRSHEPDTPFVSELGQPYTIYLDEQENMHCSGEQSLRPVKDENNP